MENMKLLAIFNYEYIIAGFIVALLYSIYTMVIKPRMDKKNVINKLAVKVEACGYKLYQEKGDNYDFALLSSGNSKYSKILIKIITVPKVSTITVNSKNTWNLHYGGSNEPGKGFPNNRYLTNISSFLDMDIEDNELKLIIVYKSTLKIQKYINESELEIIKAEDLVYNYKILTYEDIDEKFEKL